MKKAFYVLICLFMLFAISACVVIKDAEEQNTASPSASPTESQPLQSEEPSQTPIGMSPYPSNTATMYSSYAHMVSYDPARGLADFDYFDMLKGDAAVKWLVEKKGYTLAAAQEEVANFADSEYIESNVNTKLRTVDLREIPIKLIYKSDGTMVESGINGSLVDLYALYEHNKSLVINSVFYYIEVQNGQVTSVSQVYWP